MTFRFRSDHKSAFFHWDGIAAAVCAEISKGWSKFLFWSAFDERKIRHDRSRRNRIAWTWFLHSSRQISLQLGIQRRTQSRNRIPTRRARKSRLSQASLILSISNVSETLRCRLIQPSVERAQGRTATLQLNVVEKGNHTGKSRAGAARSTGKRERERKETLNKRKKPKIETYSTGLGMRSMTTKNPVEKLATSGYARPVWFQ